MTKILGFTMVHRKTLFDKKKPKSQAVYKVPSGFQRIPVMFVENREFHIFRAKVYLKLHNPLYHSVSMAEEMKNSWLFRSLTSIYMEEGR